MVLDIPPAFHKNVHTADAHREPKKVFTDGNKHCCPTICLDSDFLGKEKLQDSMRQAKNTLNYAQVSVDCKKFCV